MRKGNRRHHAKAQHSKKLRFRPSRITVAILVMIFAAGAGTYLLVKSHAASTPYMAVGASNTQCNRYASPGGSDNNAGTSTSVPYATVQKLDAVLTVGQVGCLMTGDYNTGATTTRRELDFSNGAGVTITAAPGAVAKVHGTPWMKGNGYTLSYLNFDQDDATWGPGSFCGGVNEYTGGMAIGGSNDSVVHSNLYVDAAIPFQNRGFGFGIGGITGTSPSGVVIAYDRIHDVGSCSVEMHGIYDDTGVNPQIHDNWFYNIPAGAGIQFWDHAHGAQAYNNVFDEVSSCTDVGSNTTDTFSINIYHNICANNYGLQEPQLTYCATADNTQVYATGRCTGPDPGQPVFDCWGTVGCNGATGSGNSFHDNILWCASSTHCTTSLSNSSGVSFSNNTVANPQFADPNYATSHDYRLAAGSAAAAWGLWDGDLGAGSGGGGGGTTNVPSAPGSVTAVAGNGQVTVNWAANAAADSVTSYNVYRTDQTFSGPWASVTTTAFTNTDQITNGTQYCYQVTAVNAAGESAKSAQACATPQVAATVPAVPTGLIATAGNAQISLQWNANAAGDNVQHYNVYRTDTTGAWASPTSAAFTNASNVTNGTQYCYQVSAINAQGESAKTAQACATPQAPTGLTGDLNNDGHVNGFDLSIFLTHWQQTGSSQPEDFNHDNVVNSFDLSSLLGNYGK